MPDDPARAAKSAYTAGLRWLAGREMSAARVRARLIERGFDASAADAALVRLRDVGALDDQRAAGAAARTLAIVKRRGRRRVARELERLGFDPETVQDAIDAVYDDHDERQLAEQALAARLRTTDRPISPSDRRRLFAALFRQGFAPALIIEILRRHRADPEERPSD